jgi:hypothetical protein
MIFIAVVRIVTNSLTLDHATAAWVEEDLVNFLSNLSLWMLDDGLLFFQFGVTIKGKHFLARIRWGNVSLWLLTSSILVLYSIALFFVTCREAFSYETLQLLIPIVIKHIFSAYFCMKSSIRLVVSINVDISI